MWIVALLGCGPSPEIADELAALDARASAMEERLQKLEAGGSDRNARRAELQARLDARRAQRAAEKPEGTPDTRTPRELFADPQTTDRLGRMLHHTGPDGASDGYRLSALMAGSPLIRMGFRNGDVVHSVNGSPLDSRSAATEVWKTLDPSTPTATAKVTRQGQTLTVTVALDEPLVAEQPAPHEDE